MKSQDEEKLENFIKAIFVLFLTFIQIPLFAYIVFKFLELVYSSCNSF